MNFDVWSGLLSPSVRKVGTEFRPNLPHPQTRSRQNRHKNHEAEKKSILLRPPRVLLDRSRCKGSKKMHIKGLADAQSTRPLTTYRRFDMNGTDRLMATSLRRFVPTRSAACWCPNRAASAAAGASLAVIPLGRPVDAGMAPLNALATAESPRSAHSACSRVAAKFCSARAAADDPPAAKAGTADVSGVTASAVLATRSVRRAAAAFSAKSAASNPARAQLTSCKR